MTDNRPTIVRPILFGLAIGSAYCAFIAVWDYFHPDVETTHIERIVYADHHGR